MIAMDILGIFALGVTVGAFCGWIMADAGRRR